MSPLRRCVFRLGLLLAVVCFAIAQPGAAAAHATNGHHHATKASDASTQIPASNPTVWAQFDRQYAPGRTAHDCRHCCPISSGASCSMSCAGTGAVLTAPLLFTAPTPIAKVITVSSVTVGLFPDPDPHPPRTLSR